MVVDDNVIQTIRRKLMKMIKSDPIPYDYRDLKLVNADSFISMFCSDEKNSLNNIINLIDKCLKWRQTSKIRDSSLTSFPELIYRQNIYQHYQVDQTFYLVTNYANMRIPSSAFVDVYSRFTSTIAELMQHKLGDNLTLINIQDFTDLDSSNMNYLLKVSEFSSFYPIMHKIYIVGLPWLVQKMMTTLMAANDENQSNITQFVKPDELLNTLGTELTPVNYGGSIIAECFAPDNLSDCDSLEEIGKSYTISNNDVRDAKKFYEKF